MNHDSRGSLVATPVVVVRAHPARISCCVVGRHRDTRSRARWIADRSPLFESLMAARDTTTAAMDASVQIDAAALQSLCTHPIRNLLVDARKKGDRRKLGTSRIRKRLEEYSQTKKYTVRRGRLQRRLMGIIFVSRRTAWYSRSCHNHFFTPEILCRGIWITRHRGLGPGNDRAGRRVFRFVCHRAPAPHRRKTACGLRFVEVDTSEGSF